MAEVVQADWLGVPQLGEDENVMFDDEGGAIINYGPEPAPEAAHMDNLAEFLSDDELGTLANQLVADFDDDLRSRKEWLDTLKDGWKLLGLKIEEMQDPFPGACGAHHPLMLEAALQFNARALGELVPPGGPVKTKIVGKYQPEKMQQAQRVREFMNYQLTEEMTEWFEEQDTLLFHLPIYGSAFKKTYWDPALGRPTSRYIAPEDFVVAYETTDHRTSGRFTHVLRPTVNDLRKSMASGHYRQVDFTEGTRDEGNVVRQEKDDIAGARPSDVAGTRELLEMHVELDLPGYEDTNADGSPSGIGLPYVVTIDRETNQILAIYRGWAEEDPYRTRLNWITRYRFLPGPGFYGLGLIHVLGNLQKTATAILRNLVDAGTFANLPAGFKQKGVKIAGGDAPLKFGEWRDAESYGDDLHKALVPIPSKEPSQTLYALLGTITEEGRRLAATLEVNASDLNNEAPVGTTMAIIEQGMKVMTGIHRRLHRAQREEFAILARVNRDNLEEEYPYEVEGNVQTVLRADFDGRIDVLPVSDPNIFSETQRIMRAQSQLQLAQQFPDQHNLQEALRQMHEVLGSTNLGELLPGPRGPKPMDPVTEGFAIMHSQPVKAYVWQEHQAHIDLHMIHLQQVQPNADRDPISGAATQALMAHIAEHEAHKIRLQLQQMSGIQLPPPPDYDPTNPQKDDGWEPMDPQTEAQIAVAMSQAAKQLAEMAKKAEQAKTEEDPHFQLEKQKVEATVMKAQASMQKAEADAAMAQAKLQKDAEIEAAELQQDMTEHQDEMAFKYEELATDTQLKREEMQMDLQTVIANNQRNDTAQERDHAAKREQAILQQRPKQDAPKKDQS